MPHAPNSPHHGENSGEDYNIFRDSLLRYCWRKLSLSVAPSYLIAFGYCLADAASSGYQVMSEDRSKTVRETRSKEVRAAIAGFDTLLWQGLASVAIPGGVINLIVRSSRFAVARTVGLPILVSKWLPTAAGLGSIPFIITPIDNCVDYALDNSTRKMLGVGYDKNTVDCPKD
ncbi:hypothetical protein ACHAXR_008417 [Thalassiosira sp. AJA248-18]